MFLLCLLSFFIGYKLNGATVSLDERGIRLFKGMRLTHQNV